jgi:hypothetical protein
MTTTLTREQIEIRIANNKTGIDILEGNEEDCMERELIFRWKEENEICTLALKALDMQPRPIAEAPKDGTFIYGHHTVWDCWICVAWSNFSWVEKTKTTRWPPDAVDLFIPISAPPKVQP